MAPPFTPHGIKNESFERAIALDDEAADKPIYLRGAMRWIQFESTLPLRMSPWATKAAHRDLEFRSFASRAKKHFEGPKQG